VDKFSRKEVARIFGLSTSHLRYWEEKQFVTPSLRGKDGRQYYSFRDLKCLKRAVTLLNQGASFKRLREGVAKLKWLLPDVKDPLFELRVCYDGKDFLIDQKGLRFNVSGQIVMDFSTNSQREAEVKSLTGSLSPEEWYRRAYELDSHPTTFYQAEEAYLKALELRPDFIQALTNLGTLYYNMGKRKHAEQLYLKSLAIDPDNLEANYNLANLLEDRNELIPAINYYKRALSLKPDFADAHFNLALLYQKCEMKEEAKIHWKVFIDLEPFGPDAQIAREFLKT
jgi:tetratricopeptide (TPR) repeat protein